jgi:hypothetical protein
MTGKSEDVKGWDASIHEHPRRGLIGNSKA